MGFKIQANITLISEGGRTLPIKSGYRPGFSFIEKKQTSGSIILLNQDFLFIGESADVEVLFFSEVLLGNIDEKTTFEFFEGGVLVGYGSVINVIGWVDLNRLLAKVICGLILLFLLDGSKEI